MKLDIEFKGRTLTVDGEYEAECGDGWSEPHSEGGFVADLIYDADTGEDVELTEAEMTELIEMIEEE